MSERVVAEVILRARDGSSIMDTDEPITAETIGKHRVEEAVTEEASAQLRELGFEIEQVGPTSLTISGDKGVFERVFQTRLQAKDKDILESKSAEARASYYEAEKPIEIPMQLADLVAHVALPTPPEFFP